MAVKYKTCETKKVSYNEGFVGNKKKVNEFIYYGRNSKFKNKVIRIMLANGASHDFIEERVTDFVIKDAQCNNFSPESVAWALMQ